MRRIKILVTLVLFMGISVLSHAQNGINSPYSRYGIGLLSDQSVGINKSLSGLGYGISLSNTINALNPASYHTVDTLTFLMDFGVTLQNVNFSENGAKVNSRNSSIDYFAIQFRLLRNLGMTVALLPYSNTGYSFSESRVIRNDDDGVVTANNSYSGNGGLRQLVMGLGWKSFGSFSAGVNASVLFGELSYSISNTYSLSSIFPRNKNYNADVSSFKLDFGVQDILKMGKNRLVVGAVFSPAKDLRGDCTVTDVSGSSSRFSDTISNAFRIPNSFGAGITFCTEKYIIGADISYQMWSDARFFGESTGNDRFRISLGCMYHPDVTSKKMFQRSSYRVGMYLQQPYYRIGGDKGPMEYGVSLGIALPIVNAWNNQSCLNISGQYVHVQPQRAGMVTENYLRINLGISFMENWFYKWKVQ